MRGARSEKSVLQRRLQGPATAASCSPAGRRWFRPPRSRTQWKCRKKKKNIIQRRFDAIQLLWQFCSTYVTTAVSCSDNFFGFAFALFFQSESHSPRRPRLLGPRRAINNAAEREQIGLIAHAERFIMSRRAATFSCVKRLDVFLLQLNCGYVWLTLRPGRLS